MRYTLLDARAVTGTVMSWVRRSPSQPDADAETELSALRASFLTPNYPDALIGRQYAWRTCIPRPAALIRLELE